MLRKLPFLLLGLAWTVFVFAGGWFTHSQWGTPRNTVIHVPVTPAAKDAAGPGALSPTIGAPAPNVTPNPNAGQKPPLLLEEAWSKVRDTFVGTVPDDTQRNAAAIRGALGILGDKYTTFLEPKARQAEKDSYRGKFGGIGVNLSSNPDGAIALMPRKNTPAERIGIQPNDILVAVDDWLVPDKYDVNELVHKVRGDPGTKVKITIKRGGDKVIDFVIVRETIEIPSVESRMITDTSKSKMPIGYVQIFQFVEPTANEAKKAIEALKADGAKGYIIDLRNNGGGLVNQSVEVASQFLSDGLVLIEQTRDKEGNYPVVKGGLLTDPNVPVVVLVNANTASASEILAGALQDRGRAKLVGEKTFGKGSMQWLFDLSDGSSVHVTFAKWFTPSRRAIDGVGLTPDKVVTRDKDEISKGIDSQLDQALMLLNGSS